MKRSLSAKASTLDINAKDIFHASAMEVEKLQALCDEIQLLSDDFGSTGANLSNKDITKIQGLDYISQSLSALTNVLKEAADLAPESWQFSNLNSVKDVPLTLLRKRFTGEHIANTTHMKKGSCDFF